jgi:hypothetical protein
MALYNSAITAFSTATQEFTSAEAATYEGSGLTGGNLDTTFDPGGVSVGVDPEAPSALGFYVYDPNLDPSLGNWSLWLDLINSLGGSAQSVFDLGTPTRRWRNIYCETGVDVLSDGDRKRFIRDCDLGVEFLMRLRPVSFSWKRGAPGTFHGFIGQEVAAATEGLPFSGVAKSDGAYSLRYTELVAPLVKAVQEQQATISTLEDELALLRSRMDILESAVG